MRAVGRGRHRRASSRPDVAAADVPSAADGQPVLAHRRQLADLPGVLRPADRHGHRVGAGDQRGLRVHVDADQPAARPPARRASRWPSTGPSRRSATSWSTTYKADRDAAPDILRQQMGLVRQVVETLEHPDPREAGLRGRRHHRHARHPGPRPAATTSSSSPATATPTSWSRTRTSRSSTTGAACRDYALYDEAGIKERTGVHPDAVPAVRRAAGRPVRQPARRARAWARRRRPS